MGLIEYIFGKILVNKLSNDEKFLELSEKVDKNRIELINTVRVMKSKGEKIPETYKVYLGEEFINKL